MAKVDKIKNVSSIIDKISKHFQCYGNNQQLFRLNIDQNTPAVVIIALAISVRLTKWSKYKKKFHFWFCRGFLVTSSFSATVSKFKTHFSLPIGTG